MTPSNHRSTRPPPKPMPACLHCGTSFSPARDGEQFCCSGCEFVHNLIRDEGLERFYDLQDTSTGRPVLDRPFQPAEFGWLDDARRRAEEDAGQRPPSLQLHVRGISCVGCVWLIEKLFTRHPGSIAADVFPSNGRLDLTWRAGDCDLPAFAAELHRFGYGLEPCPKGSGERDELDSLTGRLGLCGAFAMNAMVFTVPRYLGMERDFALAGIFELVTVASATFALLVGGACFIRRAWAALRQRVLHIDLPIALGLLAAYAGSLVGWALGAEPLLYFDFVAIFTFLMLGGRYVHLAATENVRRNMRAQNPLPDEITLDDGSTVPLDELETGAVYRVASGEIAPVASFLECPRADLSLAWMTGEPVPVTIQQGARIPAGALNLNRDPITLQAEETAASSLVVSLARKGRSEMRSPLLERILRVYLTVVLALAFTGALAWAIFGRDLVTALQVGISILVVSCPCALGVALPLLDQRAATGLQRLGVFVQTPTLWSRLRRVRKLLLDKTGTLTLERPQLDNTSRLETLNPAARSALATLSAASLHPLARSLFEALGGMPRNQPLAPVHEIPGFGVRMDRPDGRWSLGRPGWDGTAPSRPPPESTPTLSTDLRHDGALVKRFEFREMARPDARNSLATLARRHGVEVSILSGDHDDRVKHQARLLNLNPARAHGNLSPEDKADLVRTLNHDDTLYLGDGANDALAFEAALASGTPAADRSLLDSKADFFFTARGLGFLPALIETARWRHRIARQILIFAVLYNIAAVAVCLAGAMSPVLAAVLMPLSSLFSLALAARPLPRPSRPAAPRHDHRPAAPNPKSAIPRPGPRNA